MTQTARDWQKDMEMCKAATPGPWEVSDECGEPTVINSNSLIAMEVNEVEATFIAESRTALPYWLQKVRDLTFEAATSEAFCEAEKARADAAEARVEEMKELYNREYKKVVDRLRKYDEEEPDKFSDWLWESAMRDSENRRADAAEAREQRLKEALEKLRDECEPEDWYYGPIHKEIKQLLSTLYPDTPAPTPKEEDHET